MNPKHRVSAFRIIFVWEATYLACRKSSLLKGLCLWPHLFRRPQQEWPPSPTPPLPPRGSKVKFSRWFRLIFFGPANWAGLNSARRVSATWWHEDWSQLTKWMSTRNCWSFLTTKWGQYNISLWKRTSSRRPPPVTPYCRPPPLWGGLLSKFLLFCELVRRGPGKLSALGKEGSRLRL